MTEYLHWFFGLPEIVRLICAGVTMLFGALVTAFGWVYWFSMKLRWDLMSEEERRELKRKALNGEILTEVLTEGAAGDDE